MEAELERERGAVRAGTGSVHASRPRGPAAREHGAARFGVPGYVQCLETSRKTLSTRKFVKSYESSSVMTQGVSRVSFRLFLNLCLVTAFYGFPVPAEQKHTIKSWMSRVKHPKLRLSQNVTT